jgi:predicted transposase/invertase (TIGR01784 family)
MEAPEAKKAMTTREFLIQDKQDRYLYAMRQKARLDEASFRDWVETKIANGVERGVLKGYEIGIEVGMKKAETAAAQKLLAEGLDEVFIERVTGLSKAEIQKLVEQIQ